MAVAAGGLLVLTAPDAPATAAPPVSVTVAVTSAGTDNPGYRIDVRNDSGATVETTLRQELPPGAAPIAISDGGRAAPPAGRTSGTEVSWRLQLVTGGTATVHTELMKPPPDVPVTAPACAFAGDGDLPYDCASATWHPAKVVAAPPPAPPWWRRPPVLLAGLAALLLIAAGVGGWAWWRRRREPRRRADLADPGPAPAGLGPDGLDPDGRNPAHRNPAGLDPGGLDQGGLDQGGPDPTDPDHAGPEPAGGGTPPGGRAAGRRIGGLASGGAVYRAGTYGGPRLIRDEPPAQPGGGAAGDPAGPGGNLVGGWWQPAAPPGPPRRPRPPAWLAVTLAAVLAAGLATTVIATASTQVTAISTVDREPSSGAWIGRTIAGQVGAPLRDSAFEFTIYRLACPDPSAAAGGGPTEAAAAGAGVASPTAGAGVTPPTAGPDAGGTRCQVTVGLHNVSGREQHWDGSLQRAYLPGGDWVTADETATLAANAGRDYFAQPVPPGQRIVFPLVFTLPGPAAPTRVELRSEVFSAGISVDVPR